MSYDISVYVTKPGTEVGDAENGLHVIEVGNYTSNVAPMWRDALGDVALGNLIDRDGRAATLAPLVRAGVERMEADPDRYRAMNPENNWGDYDGALAYLRNLAEACEAMAPHPGAWVECWR